jgi:hypothetical protein
MRSNLSTLLRLVLLGITVLCLLIISIGTPAPAWGMLRQQQEAPGETLYQSRHSLRDETQQTWQVVLFKRMKEGTLEEVNLRLVGFPKTTEFIHPQGLTLRTQAGEVFQGRDCFAKSAPAPNVGQYDMQEILPKLSQARELELTLPLSSSLRHLKVPFPILLEWQELAQSTASDH